MRVPSSNNAAEIVARQELITRLRWAALAVLVLTIAVIYPLSGFSIQMPIVLIVAAVLIYNLLSTLYVKALKRCAMADETGRRAGIALAVFGLCDLIALISGIYYTGGIGSPYLLLVVTYVVAVGIVFPAPAGYAVATLVNLLLIGIELLTDNGFARADLGIPSGDGLAVLLHSRQYGVLLVPELVIWLLFACASYLGLYGMDYVVRRLNRRQSEVSELLREREKTLARLAVLQQIGTEISSLADLNTVLDLIVRKARDLFSTDIALLALRESDDERITIKVTCGEGADTLKGITLRPGQGMGGLVMSTGQPIAVVDYPADPRLVERPPGATRQRQLKSGMAARLSAGERALGVLYVFNQETTVFDASDLDLLSALANQAAIAIQNADLFTDLRKAALTDSLTGLYNWRYLREMLQAELARATRYGGRLSLIMADCDSLKDVNDRFGHQVGDQLLLQTGRVLKESVRESDTVIRYGGDEFVILLPETDIVEASEAAERMRLKVVVSDLVVDGRRIDITVSFGIVTFPDDAVDADDMLRKADNALYHAKSLGKNMVCRVEPAL
ncbi:MAG: sensor domain-containing diguanylate cyclase [Chloroflexi bacterium]|nr:sensor domain-containing diguanylate cyclase [Chloroflexota bacterium]